MKLRPGKNVHAIGASWFATVQERELPSNMRRRIVSVVLAVFAGCGHDQNNQPDGGAGSDAGAVDGGNGGDAGMNAGPAMLKSNIGLDLSHIVGFAIGGGPAARRIWPPRSTMGGDKPTSPPSWPDATDGGVGAGQSTLYAIDDQGNFIVTYVTTPTGAGPSDGGALDLSSTSSSMIETPTAVYDTSKYVVIGYLGLHVSVAGAVDGGFADLTCSGIILRKSDGALFCYPDASTGDSLAMGRLDSDGTDRLFLRTGMGRLTRIDASGSTLQTSQVVDSGVNDFTVNTDADVLASAIGSLRVYKQNGGLININTDGSRAQWLAPSAHDFYYLYQGGSTTPGTYSVGLSVRQGDGSFVQSMAGAVPQPYSGGVMSLALVTATNAYGWVRGLPNPPNNTIVELLGASQGTTHNVPPLTQLLDARGVGNSIFVQGTDTVGNGGIVRVDVPAFTTTTLLPPGDFSLTAISVSKTGELSFAGLRNSDGAHIVGNVPAGSSTYTILSATAPAVTILQRIN